MILIRLLDILWEMFTPRNIRGFSQRARMMWPITRRFLQQKRLQVALMSLAVALGFSAYLVFQAVFGQNTNLVLAHLEQPNFPTNVIVAHKDKLSRQQVADIQQNHFARQTTPAIAISPFIQGATQPILGFAPNESFWRSQVTLVAGSLSPRPEQLLLPQELANAWQVEVGDTLHVLITGKYQPIQQASMTVCGIFHSDQLLFDRPITVSNSSILAEYSLQEPNILFIDCHASNVQRIINSVNETLQPAMGQPLGYSWLRPNEESAEWVIKAGAPYTILWNSGKSNFTHTAANRIVANNYSSGRGVVWLVFLFSALCIFNVLLISLLTRRRDVGILKTIGYDDFAIFTNFLVEAGVIVGSGIIGGALVTQVGFALLSKYYGLALSTSWWAVLKSGLLSFIIYMSSASIPADMARYTSVMELLQESPLRSSWEEDPLYYNPTLF